MYKKILIANRGEVACRIARTLRRMGIAAATVHSTDDAQALHVQDIGESIWIGDGAARDSYLNIEAILKAARTTGADAIHPGFGFLSENPGLAARCGELGIAFIGPTAETLELFGDKAASKALAQRLGIPIAAGVLDASDDVAQVMRSMKDIPLPCVVKAVAGGGGKGMRVIHHMDAAQNAIEAAIREGRSSFADGRVIIERYLSQPRHIEVQILGDGEGNVIHLYDRECSLQRRHQKVLEEAPVCSLVDAVRAQLWDHAVALGREVRYRGLGTVEFAVTQDAAIFLEVNPRLQVEHPVTEGILGLDLIELQIRAVASGRLAITQDDVPVPNGHAVQVRLYAEDAEQGFMPSTGTVRVFHAGPGVRVDSGIASGSVISPHYDPMIAKLIAHDGSRRQALQRLRDALYATTVLGVTSNRAFLLELLDLQAVRDNDIHTETIDQWIASRSAPDTPAQGVAGLMAVWRHHMRQAARDADGTGAWQDDGLTGWRLQRAPDTPAAESIAHRYQVASAARKWRVGFGPTTLAGGWPVRVDDELFIVHLDEMYDDGHCLISCGDTTLRMQASCCADRAWADTPDRSLALDISPLHSARARASAQGAGTVAAPIMGTLIGVHVQVGQSVAAGERLATLESMKMEMPIQAAVDGTIEWIGCTPGTKVERNQALFRVADTI
ncbi:biotin carboxylase N-terminal domain-containing protein [Castellaniella sp.]|uniref:acetyl/propionyl/methylcrotonyl-CoA carboxylase subunit alpha n=1 Tax=Castellaniella sp. TaxID=1955812 RepID=UPI00355DDE00